MNLTYRYACMCKAALLSALLFVLAVSIALARIVDYPNPWSVPYNNSLFIRADQPGYLGYAWVWTSRERARHIILP